MNIDANRFLSDLRHLRSIGARGAGVARRAFSPEDIAAREWLLTQCEEAGLEARMDSAGNVWGLAEGRSLLIGSHSDTQPEGGWLDGALGVIAGLEVARAAHEAGGPPVSCVSFQDEEGRFGALTGSEIWTGGLPLAEADALVAADGTTFLEARSAVHVAGPDVAHDRFTGFLELHIEQGPVLEAAGEALGAVTGIVGARQMSVTLLGEQNHAGTTPMPLRRDAVAGFASLHAEIARRFDALAAPDTVWTVGRIDVFPNAASVVPGRVTFTLQWRDAATARLADMEAAAREAVQSIAASHGLEATCETVWEMPPTAMAPDLLAALAAAAEDVAPGRWRKMPSGALHDAANVARILPAGMLFVPSKGGISHSFEEDTDEADLVTGLRALAVAASRLAA